MNYARSRVIRAEDECSCTRDGVFVVGISWSVLLLLFTWKAFLIRGVQTSLHGSLAAPTISQWKGTPYNVIVTGQGIETMVKRHE